MIVDGLEWDDAAFLLALLTHQDLYDSKRCRRIRRVLIAEMRFYDGDSAGKVVTPTPDIKNRVNFWRKHLRKTHPNPGEW